MNFLKWYDHQEANDLILKVDTNQAYFSRWQHNPHIRLEAKYQTPETAENLVAQVALWVERFRTTDGPWKKLEDPIYFRWYCFSRTLIEVLVRTEHLLKVQIALDGTMACGGDTIWPLFCRLGPSAIRMYQLMIAAGFLRGEHSNHRSGSAAASDPGYVIITDFEEEVEGSGDEVPNPEAERE